MKKGHVVLGRLLDVTLLKGWLYMIDSNEGFEEEWLARTCVVMFTYGVLG
jgi:hypothetical protein